MYMLLRALCAKNTRNTFLTPV